MGYDLAARRDRDNMFHFSVGGMEVVYAVLSSLSILDNDYPFPQFPDHPGREHFDEYDRPTTPQGRQYIEQWEKAASAHGHNGKVPAFKFRSMSGWVVTPEECKIIADAIRNADEERIKRVIREFRKARFNRESTDRELDEWVDTLKRFADYCEECADLDGFTVE